MQSLQCKKCNKMNHFQSVCLSNPSPNAEDKTNRVGHINMVCKRARVQDDSEPTLLMKDVKIWPYKTNRGLGKTTTLHVFPDTGCQQTLVAEDLVSACGLVLDQTKKKKIKSVDGNRVPCSGSTSFQAMYGGETTNVLALFTPALNKEVILSWRTLQRLKVIPKDFPSPVPLQVKAAKAEKKQ